MLFLNSVHDPQIPCSISICVKEYIVSRDARKLWCTPMWSPYAHHRNTFIGKSNCFETKPWQIETNLYGNVKTAKNNISIGLNPPRRHRSVSHSLLEYRHFSPNFAVFVQRCVKPYSVVHTTSEMQYWVNILVIVMHRKFPCYTMLCSNVKWYAYGHDKLSSEHSMLRARNT